MIVWHRDDGEASGLFHLLMETGKAFKGNGKVSGFNGREVSRRQILNHHNINTPPFSEGVCFILRQFEEQSNNRACFSSGKD